MNPTATARTAENADQASRADFTRAAQLTPAVTNQIAGLFIAPRDTDIDARQHLAVVGETLSHALGALIENVPPCPDRSAAIRNLREAWAWCNCAINHNGAY